MKIPSNMTVDQLMVSIQTVVNRIAPKYTFNGYDVDDIKQEAFMICVDALERYDQNRPLENFLSVHLSNRLKNFVRDNYYVKDVDEEKKKLLNAKHLGDNEVLSSNTEDDSVELKELRHIIDKYLPAQYRADYLKLTNNVYINKKRREEISGVILNILKEHDYA